MHCKLLTANDPCWDESLECVDHDFYHRAAYHQFETDNGEGSAYAFVASDGNGSRMVWPYLLRDVEVPGSMHRVPATEVRSAYGYPGPVFSANCTPEFVAAAVGELLGEWRRQRVVNAFTRLHPVQAAHRSLKAAAAVVPDAELICHGATVSLDLDIASEERFGKYSATVRKGIRRNQRAGVSTTHDAEFRHLRDFYRFYVATMDRNRAAEYYYFGYEYFERLVAHAPGIVHLFVTKFGDEVACTALISEFRGQLQALFIMPNPDFEDKAPSRTLIHDVCEWGQERGNHDFHLGGGRGGAQDSLFRFKAQFSDVHRDFYTCRIIVDSDSYAECVRLRSAVAPLDENETYFPAWRKPLPVEELVLAGA